MNSRILSPPSPGQLSHVAPLPGEYVRLHVLMPGEEGPLEVRTGKGTIGERQRFGVEFLKFSNGQQVRVGRLFRALEATLPA
jgi:hypothetical protein